MDHLKDEGEWVTFDEAGAFSLRSGFKDDIKEVWECEEYDPSQPSQISQLGEIGGRLGSEPGVVIDIYENCQLNKPWTLEVFKAGRGPGEDTEDFPSFLFLSAGQAREFSKDGRPRVTILVPAALDPQARPLMNLESTLEKFAAFETRNYHDMLEDVTDLYAKSGPAAQGVEKIRAAMGGGNGIINLLGLGILLPCSVPSFLVDAPGWDLLEAMRVRKDVDAATRKAVMDFYQSSDF
ncbi:hypothetical protein N0V83_006685 [Neocucurbitaria cava]|uniref:Uncharacterized protein n=1 Tax=Neocucurbitaria cava TaxID=798079 RepID=A0A9W8Y5B0_9PLEO|nr:hypothetical protein N0V83_006685 [Neocucurbitaria cava]